MCKTKFGHIHVHTEFSTLDGMPKIEELFKTVKELGQSFIAVTDHGSMSGLWRAQQAGKKYGVKPILGCEFYYERENDGENGHLIVIAKSDKGLENMMKLYEFSYVHNFYKKPRINFDTLVKYHEDLIVCSACLGSTFAQYVIGGNVSDAKEWAYKFKEVFGEDFYIEIQPNNIPEQLEYNKVAVRIADELNIKTVATNDVHYILEQDAFPHEVLLALQVGKKMSDEKRWRFPTNDFWLKSEEEMINTFIGISEERVLEAMNNTSEIADKCNAEFHPGKYLPSFYDVPEGMSDRQLLVQKTMEGAKRENVSKDKAYMKEVQNEIDVIDRNGYSGYFLVVGDYVTSARRNGNIVGDGRGSGAGSKVAWLTEITKIPPQDYDLLFERFLADGREPDFDVDFSDQDAVFDDLSSKYGRENVARIIAFGTLAPRAVCRKVFSAFDHEESIIKQVTSCIPELCPSLAKAVTESDELKAFVRRYKVEFEVIQRLEGIISHESQHAGGVIIYPNLSAHLPLKTKGEDRTKRIVAFDAEMLHDLGHFKFDVLGLTTLPTIKNCLDSIVRTASEMIDLHKIDLEDQKVYEMLCTGDVSGIFQIANQAQKVIEQQPKCFRDLIALNALIRPGVGDWKEYIERRNGKPWSVHPARMPYLSETFGLITYQEQFLLDAKNLAGWDIAYADKHIRKNKDIKNDTELREKFIHDVVNNENLNPRINEEEALAIWYEIEDAVSKGYSFNKSHAASYAVISYQTAYLKTYYPEHFYASLMSSEKTDGDGQDAISGLIAECKQRGIPILPPDINHSGETFVASSRGIAYRITTVKHVGDSAIEAILRLRPFESFYDFMQRRETNTIKKNVIINLIKAGAFDFENTNRAELLWCYDMTQRTKTQVKEGFECPRYEWNDKIKAEWEKEVLGMYLSVHPLERYGFKSLSSYQEKEKCIQGGEVYDKRVFNDKNGNEMAFVWINTLFGNVKLTIFKDTWKRKDIKESVDIGAIILVRGRKSGTDILVDSIEILE